MRCCHIGPRFANENQEKGLLLTYLRRLSHKPVMFMMSLIQTAEH